MKNKNPKIPATIHEKPTEKNGWFYVVKTDHDNVFHLRGMGAPKDGNIGDRGTIQYRSGRNFGLYFWENQNNG